MKEMRYHPKKDNKERDTEIGCVIKSSKRHPKIMRK